MVLIIFLILIVNSDCYYIRTVSNFEVRQARRRRYFNNNSAVSDSNDKSGNRNGNRGIGAKYLIRRDRGAQVEIGRGAAVLVPILLSGKLEPCLLSFEYSPRIGLAFKRCEKKSDALTLLSRWNTFGAFRKIIPSQRPYIVFRDTN